MLRIARERSQQALLRAREFGDSAVEPCLTLLRVARGDLAGARVGMDAALAATNARLHRARLLPASVELSLLAGDDEQAAGAAAELGEIASSYGSATLRAAARQAAGAVALASGDREAAVAHLVAAKTLWHEVRAPYERAQARALRAGAQLTLGNRAASLVEQRAAHAMFEQLGAGPAVAASARRLRALA